MGYNLYITRAKNFWESREAPISEDEWRAVAQSDSTLKYSNTDWYERRLDGGRTVTIRPWLYISLPETPPLWYMDGAIETKNPEKQFIVKMVELADRLGASVIGEEGEVYNASGNPR